MGVILVSRCHGGSLVVLLVKLDVSLIVSAMVGAREPAATPLATGSLMVSSVSDNGRSPIATTSSLRESVLGRFLVRSIGSYAGLVRELLAARPKGAGPRVTTGGLLAAAHMSRDTGAGCWGTSVRMGARIVP
jgi:hypothetical protein